MTGSGGIVVLDSRSDIRAAAVAMAAYNAEESCGKCTPCREGTPRLHGFLEGKFKRPLEPLLEVIGAASLCGLGQMAPGPIRSALLLLAGAVFVTAAATLMLDGVAVPAAGSVLDAVLAAGIDLPHLCKDDNLPAIGACRTCLVEADGRIVAACSVAATSVREVTTNTDRARPPSAWRSRTHVRDGRDRRRSGRAVEFHFFRYGGARGNT